MTEQWKPIEGYGGKYEVSNFGRVRQGEKPVNQYKDGKGYMRLTLHKDGKQRGFKVHRLVAMAFIPNPDNLPCVNHKDEVKANNRVDNLEWCDWNYNVNYGTGKYRMAATHYVAVIGTDKEGKEHYFASVTEAAEKIGGRPQCIGQRCRRVRGKVNYYGYSWRYANQHKV